MSIALCPRPRGTDVLRLFRHYVPPLLLALITVDLAIILGAVTVARVAEGWLGRGPAWPKLLACVAITFFTLHVAELYDVRRPFERREMAARLLLGLSAAAVLTAALGYTSPVFQFARWPFFYIFTFTLIGLLVWRSAWPSLGPNVLPRERLLVLGVSESAPKIMALQATGAHPFTVIGFLDDSPDAHERLPAGADLLAKARDLLNIAEEVHPDILLVALKDMRGALPASDLLECRLRGIRVEDWPMFYEKQTGKVLVTEVRPSWLIFSDGFVKTRLTRTVKRSVDLVLASVGLVAALPLMLLTTVAIMLDSRGPVLFRQERVGHNGRLFTLKKFRSMTHDAEKGSGPVWTSPSDPRITRVGRVLRRTRLDELPQLVNVLVGDMSFIGPRPERPEFVRTLRRQIPFYMERLTVKPGITGWAQVRYQYAASIEDTLEKLQYDLYYVKNLSLFLDILILLNTFQVVLGGRGAR